MIQSLARRPAAALAAAAAVSTLLALAVVALPSPAAAETFTVTLAAGGEFTTRYQPEEASWDTEQLLLLTEWGNWIGVAKSDVASIISETENRGYGRVIDTTTIALGWAPNDAEVPDESGQAQQASPMDALRALLDRPERSYDIEQFVEPSDTGGGLPVTYGVGVGSSPLNP